VERPRLDPAAMLVELRGLLEAHLADLPLRRLVLTILERHAGPFTRMPATRDKFYPFAGGLIEHTLAVTRTCVRLMDEYGGRYAELQPPLNRDLVVAGAVLHDIGRVLEFEADSQPPQPTVPGKLLGHLFLGRDLVREAAREQGDLDEGL